MLMDHAGSSCSLTIAAQRIFDGNDMRGPAAVEISHGLIKGVAFGEARAPRTRTIAPSGCANAGLFAIVTVSCGAAGLERDRATGPPA